MLKKNNVFFIIICLLIILLLGGGTFLYYYETHYITATFSAQKQTEITGMLNRPGCGWYRLYSYYLRPDTPLSANDLYLEEKDDDGYVFRLALLEFNLAEYADRKLDDSALNNITTVLQLFSKTKAKVIIRFLYDWDGLAEQKEPNDISIIQQHMKQAGTLLNQYCDLIYTTQGIFVGNWAEMHGSKYLTTKDMTTLIAYYASVTNPSIPLAVRTPKQYRTIVQELKEHPKRYEEFDVSGSKLIARLGLYNDGMLGSVSDTGTYFEADIAKTEEKSLAIRKEELDFQNILCQTVPNGGEVVNDNPYNDGDSAIADLTKMHVSYLNQLHDETVIRKWKESDYTGSDNLYHNHSVYDYITDHMGARYVIKECNLSYKPLKQQSAAGTLQIENKGFSARYQESVFTLSMVNDTTKEETIILNSETADNKNMVTSWNSQETVAIPFSFSPFDFDDGTYTLVAHLTDGTKEELISFANDSYEKSLNGYNLGTITIAR